MQTNHVSFHKYCCPAEGMRRADLAPLPDIKVIQNYARNHGARLREKGKKETLGQFHTFAAANPLDLEQETKPACVAHVTDVNKGVFRFLFSSPKKLKALATAGVRCLDGTYKLNWAGFPTLVVGFVDADQHFHLVAIAITYGETDEDFAWLCKSLEDAMIAAVPGYAESRDKRILVTMQDGADAIRNGQDIAYGDDTFALRVMAMCWSHMMRAVRKFCKGKVTDETLPKILADVRKLHYIPWPFTAAFDNIANNLFIPNWRDAGESAFVAYFHKYWLGRCKLWGRAYLFPGMPSTNNGLERKNRVLKDLQVHKRLGLGEFIEQVVKILRSDESSAAAPAMSPTLDTPTWRDFQVFSTWREPQRMSTKNLAL